MSELKAGFEQTTKLVEVDPLGEGSERTTEIEEGGSHEMLSVTWN